MGNRIDQLFKGKLEEYKIAPSAQAWKKVQAGLSKKNKMLIVWQLAAAFILFGLLTGAWNYFRDEDKVQPTQLTESITTPEIKSMQEPINQIAKSTMPEKKITRAKNRKIKNDRSKEVQQPTTENLAIDVSIQNQVTDNVIMTEPLTVDQTLKPEKPLVIEFTLQTISTEPAQEVEVATEEIFGLKKILDVARDVKNGDTDLGIRDAKNQLFAFDFKKDKPKRN